MIAAVSGSTAQHVPHPDHCIGTRVKPGVFGSNRASNATFAAGCHGGQVRPEGIFESDHLPCPLFVPLPHLRTSLIAPSVGSLGNCWQKTRSKTEFSVSLSAQASML
ncbi:MAG: hypothetical protein R3E89_18505 [Thiolinea sp.]